MSEAPPPAVTVSREGDAAVAHLTGAWCLHAGIPSRVELEHALLASPKPRVLRLEAGDVERWDTALVAFVAAARGAAERQGVELDTVGIPGRVLELVARARSGGTAAPALAREPRPSLAVALGERVLAESGTLVAKVDFVGDTALAALRTLAGRNRRLRTNFFLQLQRAGVETLPVVALMGFAMGGVLTLVASGQFEKLGATALVARVVAIAVLREMGSLMVGIAIAGRLGSALAAELATMVANQEVDALRLIGVNPFDYLVAPRVLALAVAGVLLVLYANALGLVGGLVAGVAFAGLPPREYVERSLAVLGYKHLFAGLIKGLVFGTVTALLACYHGLASGRSAAAVGKTVSRAVVGAVVGVVLADAAITLVFKWVRL
jgi:phospholipid/cholesterol/gamma-HCH transport system permease protein